MKLLFPAFAFLATIHSVTASRNSPVTTHDEFLSAEDIQQVLASVDITTLEPRSTGFDDGSIMLHHDGYQASAQIPRRIVDSIFDENPQPHRGSEQNGQVEPSQDVMVTTLFETTSSHQDGWSGHVFQEVAFIFLNSNPNAFFSHGERDYDNDEVIAVEAGKLVFFDGSIEHNTVVHDGKVQLAGPFSKSYTADTDASNPQVALNEAAETVLDDYDATLMHEGTPLRRKLTGGVKKPHRYRPGTVRVAQPSAIPDESEAPSPSPY